MKPSIRLFLLFFTTCSTFELNHNTGDDYGLCGNNYKCVKKCCPENQVLKKKVCVFSNDTFSFDIFDGTDVITDREIVFNVIHDYNTNCKDKKRLKLSPNFIPSDKFYIQSDGSLLKPFDNITKSIYFLDYCLETFVLPSRKEFSALVCYDEGNLEAIARFPCVGMIISMPFLLITLLVYLILPERNVHRKALMNYVFSLLFGYITLVTVQLLNAKQKMEVTECHILGYSIIFFFIVSFFWMNVMCIDMWLAFSGLRGFRGRRDAEKKKFILFCIYAWGMPSLLILITFLMNTYADKKAIYYPQLGDVRCFLENGYPNLFYFYLPMTILITVNVILCILTTVKIQKVKKETSMLQRGDSKRHNYESDKQKFKLYLKLIFAMGVNWSMEVISWLVQWRWNEVPEYLWYVTDFVNAAYGILIFIIFVCKKNIYYQLKKRYYVWRGKPHLAHTLSGTNTTRSAVSTTCNTVVSMDYRLNDLKNGQVENKPLSG